MTAMAMITIVPIMLIVTIRSAMLGPMIVLTSSATKPMASAISVPVKSSS